MNKKWLNTIGIGLFLFCLATGVKAEEILSTLLSPFIQNPIHVQVDEKTVVFPDRLPYIDQESQRTFVPIRFIAEELGAHVDWDGEKQRVTLTKGNRIIQLVIGEKQATVDGRLISFDAKAVLNHDRAFVPLRFISESFGAKVAWVASERTVKIRTAVTAAKPQNQELFIGQKADQVTQLLGPPQRKDLSSLGFAWWIYNKNLNQYVQVGIQNGKVVDLYSNATTLKIHGIQVGTSKAELAKTFTLSNQITFDYDGASFSLSNPQDDRPLALDQGIPVIFYLDAHDGYKVSGIRMLTKELLIKSKSYDLKWTYSGKAPQINPPILTTEQKNKVQDGYERQSLDLVNVSRQRFGLPSLTWNEQAAIVARGHSRDMLDHHFFDHVSASSGLDPFERMKKGGIHFSRAGENIAMGYPDSIEAHQGWMNSLGHRKNILNKDFTTLGVGVVDSYYTQNFVTP